MSLPSRPGRLRRVILAYAINRLGTWFGLVALMVVVFDHTHSALGVAGLLLAAQALPAFLVPAVVARVEASPRRSELSSLYFFEALTTGIIALLLSHFWLPAVLLLAALDGTAALTASALLRAAVARAGREQAAGETTGSQASDEELAQEGERKANAALNVAFSATFVAGPAIAGAVVASAGAVSALLIDVGSFLLCGAMLIDLRPHIEEASSDTVGMRLRAAWQHINDVPRLRALLLAEIAALAFIESAGPIEVGYVKTVLHAGDRGFGLLLTAWGAGAVIGSLVFARLIKRSLPVLLSAGTFAIGAAYVGFAAAPSLPLACLAALIGGIGNGLQWPSLISLVQQLTPQALHGRLMGAVESIGALCTAFGLMLGGAVVALTSDRVAFYLVGVGAILTTGAFLRIADTRSRSAAAADGRGAPSDLP